MAASAPAEAKSRSVLVRERVFAHGSRLLEAAKAIFEENGFLEARISDIAERAGLSHGSFYHYFESKEEIFREVAKDQQETLSSHCIVDSGLLDTSTKTTMRERVGESNRRFLADYRAEAGIMGVIEQVSRYDDQVRAARFAEQKGYRSKQRRRSDTCNARVWPIRSWTRSLPRRPFRRW